MAGRTSTSNCVAGKSMASAVRHRPAGTGGPKGAVAARRTERRAARARSQGSRSSGEVPSIGAPKASEIGTPRFSKIGLSVSLTVGSKRSNAKIEASAVSSGSSGKWLRWRTTARSSRVLYGYCSRPSSTARRRSAKIPTNVRSIASGTRGAIARTSCSSEAASGLSRQNTEKTSASLIRSFPRKGKPGRFASTSILKLGWMGIWPAVLASSSSANRARRLPSGSAN
mmetsp:Transcript_740/g.1352  ORF Transcript_740/g.1352 Transcript_740/m.1352 type:complete len:227 (-) Transcript_740:666-1346(-)